MFVKLNEVLRKNAWLLLTGFLAFVGSAYIGSLTVDAGSTTPVIWLGTMWSMLAYGVIIMVSVLIECIQGLTGND
jgi:hypothetical protein